MKYFSFEHFDIHTKLSSDEVFYRLRASVDKERQWWILANKPFWGKVFRNNFRIRRYRSWWRNYTPVVLGEIQQEEWGCCLHIRIRWPWLSYLVNFCIFEFLWLSFFMGHANLIVQKIQTGIWQFESIWEWLFNIAAYIVFLSCFSLLPSANFRSETRFVKDHLLRMSEATEKIVSYQDRILGFAETQVFSAIIIIPVVFSIGWMIYKLLL